MSKFSRESIPAGDAWKYQSVTYDNNDPRKPRADILRGDDGSIVEKSTYSSRYLKELEQKRNDETKANQDRKKAKKEEKEASKWEKKEAKKGRKRSKKGGSCGVCSICKGVYKVLCYFLKNGGDFNIPLDKNAV